MKKLLLLAFSISFLNAYSQNTWTPSETTGFGNNYNTAVKTMHSFKGKLYAGMADDSGKIYRTATGNLGSWSECFYDTNLVKIKHLASTIEGGGYLYAAAFSPFGTAGSIYRTSDGNTWDLFHTSAVAVEFIELYKGAGTVDSIYSFENGSGGDIIRRAAYNSNDPLDTLSTWDTIFDLSGISPFARITATGQFNGKLFFGLSDGSFWSYNGIAFSQNANVGFGFGDPDNGDVSAIGVHGSYLYIAFRNYIGGTGIWRSSDETNWTMVAQYTSFERVTDFISNGTTMWANMISSGSFSIGQIVYTNDGITFLVSAPANFGHPSNNGQDGNFEFFGNNLYYGTANFSGGAALSPSSVSNRGLGASTGGQIWRTCLLTPPSITIGADQTICSGLTATFNSNPGLSSYLWNDGSTSSSISTSVPGLHYVIATDANGCDATDSATVTVIASPSVSIVTPESSPVIVCKGDTLTVSGIAQSNTVIPQPPFNKVSNVPIAYSLGNTYDTLNVTGINECSCTALYSVTIDSLYHNYNMDVSIGLYSPSGYFINLSNNAYGSNYIGTEFVMSAAMTTSNNGNGPFTGQYLPFDAFSNLTGSSNGNWVIQTNDNYSSDDGVLKGWTLKFATADSIITYSWNPTTGVTMSSALNTTIVPPVNETYVLTTTNSLGCSVNDTFNVIVPVINIASTSDSLCFGTAASLSTDGSSSTAWLPSGTLNTATGTIVVATPISTTTYYATDTVAGCIATDSTTITVNPLFTANAGSDQTICYTDSTSISATANGGSGLYAYSWSDGTNSYSNSTEFVGPVVSTSYSLAIEDAFGCFAFDTTIVNVAPSTDIYGNISYSGGSVSASNVVLYKYYPYQVYFDTIQITTTDASGNYSFNSVDHENYLIKVFPAASYTTLVPTYYGNVFLWDSASVVSHYCAVDDTLNITAVEELVLTSGPGYLHGRIVQDTGFVRVPGDPIPGVDVKLGRNPGGQLITSTTTNGNGEYEFLNVAYGNYTVFADIPGLGRDSSYTFVVDSTNTNYYNLDYAVDSNSVYPAPESEVGINEPAANIQHFIVYPNPSNGNAVIEYKLSNASHVTLGIYNMLGVKVISLAEANQQAGNFRYDLNSSQKELSAGVYFATLMIDGKPLIQKILINK
jgi:subtilisin-like proprotein convertase family protein